jgi:ribose/xylose/arabinose/galactoside ABC-type transport system permease subunit
MRIPTVNRILDRETMMAQIKTDTPADLIAGVIPRRRGLPRVQELGLVIVILIMGLGLSIFGYVAARPGEDNTFLNAGNLIDQVATPMSYYAIMAVGMTLVIISGGIDISVGSIMALSAFTGARVLQYMPVNAPAWQVLPVAFAVPTGIGLLCGLINGGLVVGLRLHPFIVTLGTLSIFRGITVVTTKFQELPPADRRIPLAFTDHFMRMEAWGHRPMPMVVMLVIAAIGWFYLSQTVGGREIYALGGNEEAARFSGLRTNWIKLRVYAVAGLTAGIAGMVWLGRFGGASTADATGYELTVVAAAVVGGASLSGGRGTALGALLGTLIIAMIQDGIIALKWKVEYQLIIVGGAIVLAAAIDNFSEYLRQRRLAGAKASV